MLEIKGFKRERKVKTEDKNSLRKNLVCEKFHHLVEYSKGNFPLSHTSPSHVMKI